jgi:hypothetical protein
MEPFIPAQAVAPANIGLTRRQPAPRRLASLMGTPVLSRAS